MPKRGLVSLILTVAALRLILAYAPPDDGGISFSPDPSLTPDPGASATPTPTPTPTSSATSGKSPKPTNTPKPTKTPTPTPTPTSTPAGKTVHNGTYTGANVNYRYGLMQVTVKIANGQVVDASVQKTGSYSIGYRRASCTATVFNNAAIGLNAGKTTGETFAGRPLNALANPPSACSGASYSWWGYANSLQNAIDQATY